MLGTARPAAALRAVPRRAGGASGGGESTAAGRRGACRPRAVAPGRPDSGQPNELRYNYGTSTSTAGQQPGGGAPPSAASGSVAAAPDGAATTTARMAPPGSARPGPPVSAAAAAASWAAKRAAANKEVAEHDPGVVAKGREGWLFFTVPDVPVAGARCMVYFNRQQSEPLRNSGRSLLHAKFNTWEVSPEEGDRLDMTHDGRIPRADGVDYYRVELAVPEEAYEINFVFSNGEGTFDNNLTQNYLKPVEGPMTRDLWIDTAPERAEAAWQKMKAEEAARKAEEEAAALAAKEAKDQRLADEGVEQIKREYKNLREGGSSGEKGRWRMVPSSAQPGQRVLIQYNRLTGPFAGFEVPADAHLTLKIGHNNWKQPQDVKMQRAAAPPTVPQLTSAAAGAGTAAGTPPAVVARPVVEEGEWWEALVTVPIDACALNFVLTYFQHYDNNDRKDFKALIDLPAGVASVEAWADGMLPQLKKSIREQRLAAEAVAAELERQRRTAREAAQFKAEAVRRRQMRHVLFTQPEVVKAGQDVTVYYNPNNTNLNGRHAVFLKGGYNRWRHPRGFGPLEMTPPTEGEHFQATIQVPRDAYSMEFVFSDAAEGGEYDSNRGLDYHLPVQGSVVEEPPLHVVHIAVEMAPICKVGGLGDVVTSLGRAVQEQGHTVEVVLPRYNFFQQSPLLGGTQYETEFDFGGTKVFVSTCMVEGLRCFFVEPRNGMFDGPVYAGNNDGQRFDFFCKAALEFLLRTGRQPDILHCHDWSTADVARSYWQDYHQYGLWKPRVIFTIHNMDFGAQKLGEAAFFSQKFTTVSPSYAWEIGGHPAIAPNVGKLMGVRNGIDIDIWDPETDKYLPLGYNAQKVVEGKAAARAELRKRLNLTSWGDKPLVGVVSRLTKQKGTHLIAHSCFRTIDRGGQFVLLGSAPDPKIQSEFDELKNRYGGDNAAFCFAFDEPLSHLIYAACDLILVPSMFEPCGLTQMIAMRYGAIPVVRQTGGLRDTIFDVDNDKARAAWEMEGSTTWQEDGVDATNGFSFEGTDDGALDYAMNRALDAYYNDRQWFHGLQKRVMLQDWSWNKPANDYIQLYYSAME
ncbi:glycosyltransferase family 5 [Micractinium conductrix]|uniref:starch synthase n=1 Tax=Micractinium conductrix TaxID=554055 RepID=A0A2P6UZ87_9CHLO|nr:glycosyltransferase family 5 [Micractinium conductrix]|eukprot:PSC67151.1 glycosyltransferase family 5 [Micractinium conductrix]